MIFRENDIEDLKTTETKAPTIREDEWTPKMAAPKMATSKMAVDHESPVTPAKVQEKYAALQQFGERIKVVDFFKT